MFLAAVVQLSKVQMPKRVGERTAPEGILPFFSRPREPSVYGRSTPQSYRHLNAHRRRLDPYRSPYYPNRNRPIPGRASRYLINNKTQTLPSHGMTHIESAPIYGILKAPTNLCTSVGK